MRVLVIENYAGTSLGQVETALRERNAEIDLRQPYAQDALPETPDGFDALILLGGAQNALDDENHPWFAQTLALIRDFEAEDKAVLGICFGAQLIARAFRAENIIGGHTEFGWKEMTLSEAGRQDPVTGGLPDAFPIFEWHDDHFGLPSEAIRLASSPIAPNQMFRIGRAAYGAQFHFEADRALVSEWNDAFADLLDRIQPDWRQGEGERQAAKHGELADQVGLTIARNWAAQIR